MVPQGTQESDSILEQQVDLTEKDSNMAKRSAKSDDNGVHVPRDPGLQPIVERFPLTLPSGEFFVQSLSDGTVMKVREVKKEPGEVTRTLPNFAGQVHHQDKDPKNEEQEKIQNPLSTANRQNHDSLPELVTKKKKAVSQFVEFQVLSLQPQKKENKNKTELEKNKRLQETLPETVENKMMQLSLGGPHQSLSSRETIVTPEVSQKRLEDLTRENMKLKLKLNQLQNKGPNEVDLTVAHASCCRHNTSDFTCASHVQQQEASRPKASALEVCADGKNEVLSQHIPTPPKAKPLRSLRRHTVKKKSLSERRELAASAYCSQPDLDNVGTEGYQMLGEENPVSKDHLVRLIRECEEKVAQLQSEVDYSRNGTGARYENKIAREKQEEVKVISDREQQLMKELAYLRRIKRMYLTQQQVPVPQGEDVNHLPTPSTGTATQSVGRHKKRKERESEKNKPSSSGFCSQPECYLVVNTQSRPNPLQFYLFPSPNSPIFIVESPGSGCDHTT